MKSSGRLEARRAWLWGTHIFGLAVVAVIGMVAWKGHLPVFMIAGLDYTGSVAAHKAIDMAAMVRDFVKWDDQPKSLNEFAQSVVRAYKLAATAPMAPVLVVTENAIQKAALPQRKLGGSAGRAEESPSKLFRGTRARPPYLHR